MYGLVSQLLDFFITFFFGFKAATIIYKGAFYSYLRLIFSACSLALLSFPVL